MERNIFIVRERSSEGYMIGLNFDLLPNVYTKGSFNVLGARVLGLSYADYCRLCRDEYGARIVGKGCLYCFPVFPDKKSAQRVVSLLNETAEWRIK